MPSRTFTARFVSAATLAVVLGGCAAPPIQATGGAAVTAPSSMPANPGWATPAGSRPAATTAAARSSPTAPAPPATAGGPAPFATVVKDARRIEGPLTLWQKDDKVWIELRPEQLGQPFLLSPKIKSGISQALSLIHI